MIFLWTKPVNHQLKINSIFCGHTPEHKIEGIIDTTDELKSLITKYRPYKAVVGICEHWLSVKPK